MFNGVSAEVPHRQMYIESIPLTNNIKLSRGNREYIYNKKTCTPPSTTEKKRRWVERSWSGCMFVFIIPVRAD